jgi:hypothetical protein
MKNSNYPNDRDQDEPYHVIQRMQATRTNPTMLFRECKRPGRTLPCYSENASDQDEPYHVIQRMQATRTNPIMLFRECKRPGRTLSCYSENAIKISGDLYEFERFK